MLNHSKLAGMFMVKRFQRALSEINTPCKRQLVPDRHSDTVFMLA